MLELRMDTDLQTALPAEIGFNFDELKSDSRKRSGRKENPANRFDIPETIW